MASRYAISGSRSSIGAIKLCTFHSVHTNVYLQWWAHPTIPGMLNAKEPQQLMPVGRTDRPRTMATNSHSKHGAGRVRKRFTGQPSGRERVSRVVEEFNRTLLVRLSVARAHRCWMDGQQAFLEVLAHKNARAIIDIQVCNALMSVAAVSGQCQGALDTISKMQREGIRPNSSTYNFAISACARSGSCKEAIALVKDMAKEGVLADDPAPFRTTIEACRSAHNWRNALDVFRYMKICCGAPDFDTYVSAIRACADGGQWQQALSCLREMQTREMKPTQATYGAVITACGNGGQWQLGLSLLKEMRAEDLAPDGPVYRAIIMACGKGGQSEHSLALLREVIESDDLTPNINVYNAAIFSIVPSGQSSSSRS